MIPHHEVLHGTAGRIKSALYALTLITFLYFASVTIEPGWLTYFIALPAIAVIILTTLSRANDINVEMTSASWQLRRVGLVLITLYVVVQLVAPVVAKGVTTWNEVAGLWGFALMMLTSPGQPPWAKYVWGKHPWVQVHPKRRKTDHFDNTP